MPVEIREATVDETVAKAEKLFAQHWEEIANFKDDVPLKPDYDFYRSIEKAGKLFVLIAEENGEVVGYSVFVTVRHPHYQTLVFANNDILFVRKDKRNSSVGLRLIEASEKKAKEKGCNKITWHIKPNHDFSSIVKRRGYIHEDTIYGRLL